MMPGMDGLETVAAIRALSREYVKDLPFIALTANAVSGMKEMFLANGFHDFLSKPIEIARLDEILGKWIPRDKQQKPRVVEKAEAENGDYAGSVPAVVHLNIEGVDVQSGLAMTGGSEEGYRKVLGAYYRDIMERLSLLQSVPANEQEAIHQFTVQVHALKSASATIGAAALSYEAADLEAAGKSNDVIEIGERLPLFYDHLKLTAEAIRKALGIKEHSPHGEKKAQAGDAHDGLQVFERLSAPVLSSFASLKEALERQDIQTADGIIAELEKTELGEETKAAVEAISDQVLMAEYGMAVDVINALLNNNKR
jgi:CheY-like chemotaxis protein